jgi:hypothetical protein
VMRYRSAFSCGVILGLGLMPPPRSGTPGRDIEE